MGCGLGFGFGSLCSRFWCFQGEGLRFGVEGLELRVWDLGFVVPDLGV